MKNNKLEFLSIFSPLSPNLIHRLVSKLCGHSQLLTVELTATQIAGNIIAGRSTVCPIWLTDVSPHWAQVSITSSFVGASEKTLCRASESAFIVTATATVFCHHTPNSLADYSIVCCLSQQQHYLFIAPSEAILTPLTPTTVELFSFYLLRFLLSSPLLFSVIVANILATVTACYLLTLKCSFSLLFLLLFSPITFIVIIIVLSLKSRTPSKRNL